MRGVAPLFSFTGRGRGGKGAFSKKIIILNAVIFYLKRKENFEYWNTFLCADPASEVNF